MGAEPSADLQRGGGTRPLARRGCGGGGEGGGRCGRREAGVSARLAVAVSDGPREFDPSALLVVRRAAAARPALARPAALAAGPTLAAALTVELPILTWWLRGGYVVVTWWLHGGYIELPILHVALPPALTAPLDQRRDQRDDAQPRRVRLQRV